ncbi:MAG TPA: murein biosynthesis integral membrane protein MurJ [Desulfobacteria bacterium]|nr:murein biosynthesis integral membrane protein MurJ [Desulfobacteria bacterium]
MSTKSVAKAAGLIAAATLISRVLGFLREALISGFFGKSYVTDAYRAGFAVPDLFYNLLVVGALSSAFIPVMSGYIAQKKRQEAWYVASTVMSIMVVLLSFVTAIAWIFAPRIIALYIPGAPAQTKELATAITRILLFQPVLLSLSGFSMGMLNSLKIFGPSAIGSVIYVLCVIVLGTVLKPFIGIKGFALGVVVGSLGNFLIQIPALRRAGFHYQFSLNFRHPGVRRIAALAFPMILSFGLSQIPVVVYQNLASSLPSGSLSALMYAYSLQQLPIGIFAYSVGLAMFPTLTEAIALNHWKQFRDSFSLALRSIMFITIPISVGMMILAEPLIHVVYQHGLFTPKDTLATIPPLVFFAFGIVEQAASVIIPRTFYALHDTWTPVVLSAITLAVNIILMNVLVRPLAQGGLALAISLSGIVNMLLLLYCLKRKIGFIDGRRILVSLLKILAGSTIMGLIVFLVFRLTSWVVGAGFWGALVNLIVGAIVGALVFFLLAVILRMQELKFVLQVVARKR